MTEQPRPRRFLPAVAQRLGALASLRLSRPLGVGAVLAILMGGTALVTTSARHADQQAQDVQGRQEQAALRPASAQERREYVLEVIGLGVSLDNYRQQSLWQAMQTSTPRGSVRQELATSKDWSVRAKLALGAGRACDAFDNAVRRTPAHWPAPSFAARPPIEDLAGRAGPDDPVLGIAENAHCAGLAPHPFINAPWLLAERPDRLLEQVFAFFDAHPDLPYLVLSADDGLARRHEYRAADSAPLVHKGYYLPAMPDAAAVLVLARRERVERLRGFQWEDAPDAVLPLKLGTAYADLARTLNPSRVPQEEVGVGRAPTVEEWLPAAAAFAARAGSDAQLRRLDRSGVTEGKAVAWKPSPWLPIPWTAEQMEVFDSLPTLGFIHRPRFVALADAQDQPALPAEARQRLLEQGWDQALLGLPPAERAQGLARVLVAGGPGAGAARLPERIGRPDTRVLALDQRLGNTGAATLFVQIALGVIASYRDGGTSAALNLRDPEEASIVLISPPSAATRAAQGALFGSAKEQARAR